MDIKINSNISRLMSIKGPDSSYYDTQERFREILDTKMNISVPEIPYEFAEAFSRFDQKTQQKQDHYLSQVTGSDKAHPVTKNDLRFGGSVSSIINTSNVTQKSTMSVSEMEQKLKGTALEGLAGAFKKAEENHGVNAVFLIGLAIHESDFGNSRLAKEKNNLFGFKAYDRSPYRSAQRFGSLSEGIDEVAGYLAKNYLRKDGKYYNGLSIRDIGKRYATDPRWAQGIERRIKSLLGL